MKYLLYISEGNIPSQAANSIQVMKMAQALAKRVPHLEVVTVGDVWSFWTPLNGVWEWYGIQRPFHIVRLPLRLSRRYPLPANYRHPAFARAAAWYASLRKPDLLFTRSERAAYLSVRMGLATVVETHRPAESTRWLAHPAMLRSRFLVGIITIAQFLSDSYHRAGAPDGKVWTFEDGVDLERFSSPPDQCQAREALGRVFPVETGRGVALYVGHLYEHRGIETIFTCARSLPDILFLLVGGWEHDVERRKRELEQQGIKNVVVLGFVPNGRLPLYYAAADVLLMPYGAEVASKAWMSPLKMFEYMAAGRPIVATDLPAIRRILQHGRNALLVPPDEPEALRLAIVAILADPRLQRRLSERAAKDVRRFTWDERVDGILRRVHEVAAYEQPGIC